MKYTKKAKDVIAAHTAKSAPRLSDLLLALGRATFARMVMKAALPVADSRALLKAFDEAKR